MIWLRFGNGKNLLYKPVAANRDMEKAVGVMDFTWIARRTFPEVLQREVFRETKQGC